MLAVLSPAKKLNFTPTPSGVARSRPLLTPDTQELIECARQLSADDLQMLMKLSRPLAELNHQRFQSFIVTRGKVAGSKQAALAFDGDTYVGLQANDLDTEDLAFAQQHLRILSGLYGLLRPLDLIQPYRLEMGTRLRTPRGKNLYEFWGSTLAKKLDKEASKTPSPVLVNLASKEYFAALGPHLSTPILECSFREVKNGVAKVVGFSAKRARGMMARFIIKNRIEAPDELQAFKETGYRFDKKASNKMRFVFLRKH